MALDLDHPALAAPLERASPYLRTALEGAGRHALALFADAVELPHLLFVLLTDEDSALHAAVTHAFADPPSVAEEIMALSPGILVVTSGATLPFSTRAVEALKDAHGRAGGEVTPADLLAAACARLEKETRADLLRMGLEPALAGTEGAEHAGAPPDHLFRATSDSARRALVGACRAADAAGDPSIGPILIAAAALEVDEELAARAGLSGRRLRAALHGRTADPTPPPPRRLPPACELSALLAGLPAGAPSTSVAAALFATPDSELAAALQRQQVTPDVLRRAARAFGDP
ncbi:MAG: Clp protease N-terminal domain-containing protein [Planctomycetota bacterium]|nr:Clp protease N-terminal domain-containing protein [Planctomycetota bacterium]